MKNKRKNEKEQLLFLAMKAEQGGRKAALFRYLS